MNQYLIAVNLRGTVRTAGGFFNSERALYRVSEDITLKAVVACALQRTGLKDERVICVGVEPLGSLAEYLQPQYQLLEPQ